MKHLIASALFYPTLLWNAVLHRLCRSRRWWDWVDEHVLLGALPSPKHVAALKALGIGAVINTCREYDGPLKDYAAAGIEQLHIPTIDYTPPTLADVQAGVAFIQRHIDAGRKVYVHCKAGRGRSATVALCYLIAKGMSPSDAQKHLLDTRPHVLPTVYKREVVRQFEQDWNAQAKLRT